LIRQHESSEWAKIASIIEENYLGFDGFVVLHGSDTMSYSVCIEFYAREFI
jgi:L-asparaginase/Glu-tRNA(Gln) amidotransferase subunit D